MISSDRGKNKKKAHAVRREKLHPFEMSLTSGTARGTDQSKNKQTPVGGGTGQHLTISPGHARHCCLLLAVSTNLLGHLLPLTDACLVLYLVCCFLEEIPVLTDGSRNHLDYSPNFMPNHSYLHTKILALQVSIAVYLLWYIMLFEITTFTFHLNS